MEIKQGQSRPAQNGLKQEVSTMFTLGHPSLGPLSPQGHGSSCSQSRASPGAGAVPMGRGCAHRQALAAGQERPGSALLPAAVRVSVPVRTSPCSSLSEQHPPHKHRRRAPSPSPTVAASSPHGGQEQHLKLLPNAARGGRGLRCPQHASSLTPFTERHRCPADIPLPSPGLPRPADGRARS